MIPYVHYKFELCKANLFLHDYSSRKKSGSVKFVGRRISHEWVIDEQKGLTEWYPGTVVSLLSGKDGEPGAVYEVLYDDDEEPYEVDHLTEDLKSSSVKFLDI
ncbi:hypothetical protein FSP39_017117 [Pinctada imbricata]|uniref:Uncharacterized protein n=1 Tax=Pinctada imbricata TaxID=66713 RepID=A0AA88YP38_PINIB|nr:hypothetical protein FSP39_017117 [Pinctada imbricata]